jgi:hypothetical protein
MEIILGEEKEEEVFLDTKYLRYSRFKNGFVINMILKLMFTRVSVVMRP